MKIKGGHYGYFDIYIIVLIMEKLKTGGRLKLARSIKGGGEYFIPLRPNTRVACCRDEGQGETSSSSSERRRVRLRRNSALIPHSLLQGASLGSSPKDILLHIIELLGK